MALFGNKKQNTEAKVNVPKQEISPVAALGRDLSSVIVKPHVTEKGVMASERGVYVFEVHAKATKYDIRDAVKEIFGVTPVKVHTVTQKPRSFMSRSRGRRIGVKGLKKAYVYLKKGDTISLV